MTARRAATVLLMVGILTATAGVIGPLTSTASPAGAIDHDQGRPGFCPSAVGVTVVVDFQQLGGQTIVRCFPQAQRATGLEALKGAGFQIAGVQRWGEAFICRIENRPSAVETVPIAGSSGYREMCLDTPPAAGYWSYWHAGNNCAWEYSQWGVKNRDVIPGGFEGWSFSLNATADSNPKPRIAAVRPGTAGGPCTAPTEPAPQTPSPSETQPRRPTATAPPGSIPGRGPDRQPVLPGGPGGGSGTTGDPSSGPGPGERPAPGDDHSEATPGATTGPGGDRVEGTAPAGTAGAGDTPHADGPGAPGGDEAAAADDPAGNVAFTGGEDRPDVSDVLRRQSGASPWAPPVAALVVAGLAAGAVLTARRRRRIRES